MRAEVGSFCLVATGNFTVAEILLLYAGFKYSYRHAPSSSYRRYLCRHTHRTVGRRAAAREAQDHRHAYHRRQGARVSRFCARTRQYAHHEQAYD
ncbi:hypothetical protein B0H13DRAFT_1063691 [Mycena leptocephala]|nr:hypothetical protein B0H13DRAFT_1063691 [Mycena leptocephala]